MNKQNKDTRRTLILTVIACSIALALIFGLHALVTHFKTGPAKNKAIQMVKILTPPPPPRPVEKLPEPELKKDTPQEEIVEAAKETPAPKEQGPPPGQDLGVDAEGGAGSDAFGLVGRKGGRELIGGGSGGGGDGGLMQKYGWYVHLLEEEIGRQMVKKAKLPGGGLQVYVRIVLDGDGDIVSHAIYGSSGDSQVDNAVDAALKQVRHVSEPPPDGMPRALKIRITVPA